VLLHDPTGLITAAVLERLGGTGELVALHSSAHPPAASTLTRYNLTPAQRAPLRHVPLAQALTRPVSAVALDRPFDALVVVATQHDPRALLPPLLALLRPSSACAVFSPFLAPLSECFTTLLLSGAYVRVQLSETWQRVYQVLPQRTHPPMNMHGASGYVLSAIRIIPVSSALAHAAAHPRPTDGEQEGRDSKRSKTGADDASDKPTV
jgi:tRNA (adenine-N(1)-)-methyltransferase non-catalytic subunit